MKSPPHNQPNYFNGRNLEGIVTCCRNYDLTEKVLEGSDFKKPLYRL